MVADRVAVVTGAGRGLGRQLARALGARGHQVLATDVDQEAAWATADEIPGAWSMALDVRDPAAHRVAAEAAAERGRLAVWVNNAGRLPLGPAWTGTDDDVTACVETNVLGVLHGCRAAVATMAAGPSGPADIVNVASLAAFGPLPNFAVYAATKHAVLGFTTSLQGDLTAAGLPIRAHVVGVDGMDTEMVRQYAGVPEAAMLTAGGRLLDTEVVARRVLGLLGSRRVVVGIPFGRYAATRILGLAPRLCLRLMARITKAT